MVTEKWMDDLIHWHLHREYVSEFKIIDNLNQHPDGITFEEWMNRQGPAITGIIKAKDVPLSLWMKLDVAPASAYSDAMAELEEIRDTHQEQIDKASAAVLEAENTRIESSNGLLEGTLFAIKTGMRLEREMKRVVKLERAAASLLGLIDALGGAGSLDDAGPDRKNLAELIDYPAILDEAGKDEEPNHNCWDCPFNKMCPDSDANRPVVPF